MEKVQKSIDFMGFLGGFKQFQSVFVVRYGMYCGYWNRYGYDGELIKLERKSICFYTAHP